MWYLNSGKTSFQQVIYPGILSFLISHTSYFTPFRTNYWQLLPTSPTSPSICFGRKCCFCHRSVKCTRVIPCSLVLVVVKGKRGFTLHLPKFQHQTWLLFWAFSKAILGLFQGDDTTLLYDTGGLHREHVQDSGIPGYYAVQRVIWHIRTFRRNVASTFSTGGLSWKSNTPTNHWRRRCYVATIGRTL